jgi:hypothetical protein
LLDTIEHVREPWTALSEVARCVKPGGLVVMTSVFLFPIHACPNDYWRFTGPAMSVLLKDFDLVVSGMAADQDFPHTALGVAAKEPFAEARWQDVSDIAQRWLAESSTSWKERVMVAVPPWLLARAYRRFRGATSAMQPPGRARSGGRGER